MTSRKQHFNAWKQNQQFNTWYHNLTLGNLRYLFNHFFQSIIVSEAAEFDFEYEI
jgi:hypothetical protein